MKYAMPFILSILIFTVTTGCSGAPDTKADERPERKTNGVAAQEFYVKGNTLLDAGDYRGAITEYKQGIKRYKGRWDIHMNMGIAYSRLGKFESALNAMESALTTGGDKELVCLFNLGNVYQERGMYSQSIDAYRAALAIDPKDPDTLTNLGAAYLFLFRYEDATATYEHLRTLAPDDPRPVHGLALILQAQNKYQEANDMYDVAHRIDPNFAMSYLNQAWVLAALDRYAEAVQSIETYLAKDPKGPYVRRANNMLETYRDRLQKQS